MKTINSLMILLLLIFSLSASAQKNKEKLEFVKDSTTVDSTEYELIVLDPGFESWLITCPKISHSEHYYRAKNLVFVSEWNSRYMNPMSNSNIYDCYIDYRADINYGYEFNYRLYYYFIYFQEVNRVSLYP